MKKIIVVYLFTLLTINIFGTTYKVGPGQTYTDLGSVPWITLSEGDTVLIYWRSTPYASKIFIRAQGTKANPVVIRGVPNNNGELPIITGENATTDPQFAGYFDSQWTENLGLFLIDRGPADDYYTYQPRNIVFEYLELTGVRAENTFTDQFGNTRNYSGFASAIHALLVEGLTVRHCKIHNNGQGIFTNSSDVGNMSTDLLIEYNEIWGNGNAGPDGREHNIYAQSLGTIIQYNKIGRLRPGSVGATVKDRSSGTIIRYNWIEASGRALDLVEAEDGWEITTAQPDYHDVYVYGNIITNYTRIDPFGVNLIHYGYDNSPDLGKEGVLYFYHNTVYIEADQNDYWYMRLFDLSSNKDTVALYNNIINLVAPEGAANASELHLMRDAGIAYIYEKNWIQEGYHNGGWGFAGEVNIISQPILGTDPGFTNTASEDFTLLNTSECINVSGALPNHVNSDYPLDKEYVKHANMKERILVGPTFELGAFENDLVVPVELETFSAELAGKAVELNWQTATEVNNYGFYIERTFSSQVVNNTTPGRDREWETIAFVEGHGNSNSTKKYSYSDNTITQSGKYSYRLKQTDIDGSFEYSNIIEIDLSEPLRFELLQNYPNPFNPTTNISFTLPKETYVKLIVYNMLGEIVAELENGIKKSGYYTYIFDASYLASGMYVYKLETTDFTKVKEMMLIK